MFDTACVGGITGGDAFLMVSVNRFPHFHTRYSIWKRSLKTTKPFSRAGDQTSHPSEDLRIANAQLEEANWYLKYELAEHERLLAQLDSEQAKLRAVIENAPEAIVVSDTQGRIISTNPTADRLYSSPLPVGEGLHRHLPFQFFHPDGRPCEPDELPLNRSAWHGEMHTNVELVIAWPDGQRRHILANTSPILDGKGKVTGAVGLFQDISRRKMVEQHIAKNAAQAEILANLSQALTEAGLDRSSVLNAFARSVTESIGDACIIHLLSKDKNALVTAGYFHSDPEAFSSMHQALSGRTLRLDEGWTGEVFQSGKPLLIKDIPVAGSWSEPQQDFWPLRDRFPIHSLLVVPLRVQNRVTGTLALIRTKNGAPFYLEDSLLIEDLAKMAAMAIENARLYAEEAQRARELKALNDATSALLTTLDLNNLLGQILDAAQQAIPTAEKGELHLLAPETGKLQIKATIGFKDPRIKKVGRTRWDDFPTRAVRERKPILILDNAIPGDNLHGSSRMQSAGKAIRSAIAAPLIVGDKVLGALALSATRPAAFSDADLHLLVSFAATTTAAIQNATLHSELQRLALTDALTELYNRRAFFEVGQREFERFRRSARPLSAIMVDIDNFKEINDGFGHTVGDQVLRILADRCNSNIRQTDLLGRYGGDEYGLLLPETELDTAREVAERIRKSIISTPFLTEQGLVEVTVSLGITSATPEIPSFAALIARADVALYTAKQSGKNRIATGP